MDRLFGERQNVRPHSVLEPVRPSLQVESNKPTLVDYSSSDSSASDNDNGSDDDEDEKSSKGAEEDKVVAAAVLASLSGPIQNDEVSSLSTSRSSTNSNLQQLLHEAGEENKEKKRHQLLGEPNQHNTSIITIHSSDASCSSASTSNKPKKHSKKPISATASIAEGLIEKCEEFASGVPNAILQQKIKVAKKEKEYGRGGGKSQDLVAVLGDSKLKEIELKERHFSFERDCYEDSKAFKITEMENENIRAKEAIKADTRKTIMVELIRKGAKPEEIKEFLDLLGEV